MEGWKHSPFTTDARSHSNCDLFERGPYASCRLAGVTAARCLCDGEIQQVERDPIPTVHDRMAEHTYCQAVRRYEQLGLVVGNDRHLWCQEHTSVDGCPIGNEEHLVVAQHNRERAHGSRDYERSRVA